MGNSRPRFGDCDPLGTRRSRGMLTVMTSPDPLLDSASALLEAAHVSNADAKALQ